MPDKDTVDYWFESAEKEKAVADVLYKSEKYDWCLFFWHLVLEKTLKGLIIQKGGEVLPVHDLLKLAKQADLDLDEEVESELKEITTFNLEARYDDYKLSFYKKAKKEYATEWSGVAEKLYKWLLEKKKN